jgi:hypothetical protein
MPVVAKPIAACVRLAAPNVPSANNAFGTSGSTSVRARRNHSCRHTNRPSSTSPATIRCTTVTGPNAAPQW